MKRPLVVLACIALLLSGASATVVAQSAETTYSLGADGSVPVHDRQVTIDDTEHNVTSLVGLYPGQEAVVNVTAPADELAVVTVRTPDGTVAQKNSVTSGESVLVDSSDYDPGTYYLVLSTGDRVRTVSLLVVSSYRVSYGLDDVTNGSLIGSATVLGGVNESHGVQFVLTNEEREYRANTTMIRNGLYEFDLPIDGVADGNYTGQVRVLDEATEDGSRPILATSEVRSVTVGDVAAGVSVADDSATDVNGTETASDSTAAPAEAETGTVAEGAVSAEAGATTGSNSAMPDLGPVVLFAALVSWAVVARVRRRD